LHKTLLASLVLPRPYPWFQMIPFNLYLYLLFRLSILFDHFGFLFVVDYEFTFNIDMRFYFMIGVFLLFGLQMAKGQDITPSAEWGQDLANLQQNGMLVLGSWAVGNFAVSGYQMTRTKGTTYYFHQMNVFWNSVNMAIAVGGYLGAGQMTGLSPLELYDEYNNFSKILLFNTGLDVAYVMTGLYLRERSGNVQKHTKRLKGYGNSLILQGGFLFAFDLVLVLINEQALGSLSGSKNLQLSLMPGGLHLAWQF